MWNEYHCVTSIDETLAILAAQGSRARIVAGATDLMLELERGARKDIHALIDITRIMELDEIRLDEDETVHLGPMVTHNHCVASKLLFERAFPLARAAWEIGAPQIRNRGTVAGNLITASPANDTIPPLMALGAKVVLRSKNGERIVALDDFYAGVRRTRMQPDEMLVDINFPAMRPYERGTFIKIGLRRAQAISSVNAAVILGIQAGKITRASITLGSVAPTIVHALEAENYLLGKAPGVGVIESAAELAQQSVHPIDDLRGTAKYRFEMVRLAVLRCLRILIEGDEKREYPSKPVLLQNKSCLSRSYVLDRSAFFGRESDNPIVMQINGIEYAFNKGYQNSLLRLIRDEAGLAGTKEGCAEGECGACTVYLDGMAVMSCLVPAPRAHHARIVTIEGLSQGEKLHPVQQAFIDAGAVQCGYCTPGLVMSGAILLEEFPTPSQDQIEQAITGNLCRCTGYYKIIAAIEQAAQASS